jgi:hypothetical protein
VNDRAGLPPAGNARREISRIGSSETTRDFPPTPGSAISRKTERRKLCLASI